MERYRDAIDRRSNARMAREEADGTVFFKGPVETLTQELKLVDGALVFIQWVAGGDSDGGDNHGYRLRRLDGYRWGRRTIRMSGEFHYQCAVNLHRVNVRKARIVRKTVHVRLPVENEHILRAELERALRRSETVERTPASVRAGQYLEMEIVPIGRALAFTAKLPRMAVHWIRYRDVDGVLLGFEESDGKHYPRYSFSLPDGTETVRVDTHAAVEDLVDEQMAMRILHRKYPRDVRVRCSRRDPGDSRCVYV